MKLLFREAETEALRRWLAATPATPWVSSELLEVETIRACRRFDETAIPAARLLLFEFNLMPIARHILERAGSIGARTVRSLDAIHLASALSLGDDLTAFVAYDRRLQAAAEQEHLPVAAPA